MRSRAQQRYDRLLDTTSRVVGQAKRFSDEIGRRVKRSKDILKQLALDGLRQELGLMIPRVRQVMKQTRARLFRGNTRSEGKLLSLFEPSAGFALLRSIEQNAATANFAPGSS